MFPSPASKNKYGLQDLFNCCAVSPSYSDSPNLTNDGKMSGFPASLPHFHSLFIVCFSHIFNHQQDKDENGINYTNQWI